MASPAALRILRLQQEARRAAVEAAQREAMQVAARQRSMPNPRAVPLDDAPLYMDPTPGEVPATMPGEGMSPAEFAEPRVVAESVTETPNASAPELINMVRALGNSGTDALSIEDALELVRAGADPELVFSGPLPQAQVRAILRKVQSGAPLTPEELAGLRRSQVQPDMPPPPPTVTPAAGGEVRPFAQIGNTKQLVGEDGTPVTQIGDDRYLFEDGTVVDTLGNVIERRMPGDLTTTDAGASLDPLEASATPIDTDSTSPRFNLTANAQRPEQLDTLADAIRSYTTPSDEPLALTPAIRRMFRSASRDQLLTHPALAEGIESVAAKRDPAVRAEAIARAQARLDEFERIAGVSTQERAVEQLARAADARDIAATPRTPNAARATSPDDMQAARQLLEESMPEGDWNALASVFNALPVERRAEVIARLSSGQELEPATASVARPHPMGVRRSTSDPTASRPFVESMLTTGVDGVEFLPNKLAEMSRGVNPLEDALIQLDAAKRSGDPAAVEAAREVVEDIRTRPDISEEAFQAMAQEASQSFMRRQQAAADLRNAIIGTDPLYAEEQARMIAASQMPAPRPAIAPDARTPVVATRDLEQVDMPSAEADAMAVAREREERLDKQAPGGGLSERIRKSWLGEDAPLAFRGRDRSDPFESRPPGSRLTDDNDDEAIAKAMKLEEAVRQADAELQSAQGAAELARAQQNYRAALKARDTAFGRGGRAAKSERWINRPGQQETYDSLVVTLVGGRPKVQPRLDRSSPAMSPLERAVLADDAATQLGDPDLLEMMPDEDVGGATGAGKKGRLGGQQQGSRVQGALQTLYGDINPLGHVEQGEVAYRFFDSPREAAEDLLSKQTLFKPGTAAYDLARDKIADILDRTYGKQATAASKPVSIGEDGVVRPVPMEPVSSRAQEAATVDLLPETPEAPAKKPRRSKKAQAGVDDKLEASATDLSEVSGDAAPVGGKAAAEIEQDILSEAEQVYQDSLDRDPDSGLSKSQRKAQAAKERDEYIEKERAARIKATGGDASPVGATDGAAKPSRGRRGKKDAPPAADAPATADGVKPVAGDSADVGARPDADGADIVDDVAEPAGPKLGDDGADISELPEVDTKPKPADAPSADKKKRGWFPWLAGGAAVGVGIGGLARINSAGGGGTIDIPLPPGGPGGGGPGGGDYYPIPVDVGASGSVASDAMTEEQAIERALDRIRGARSAPAQQSYQTLQNYLFAR